MTIFFCVLLTITLLCGRANNWFATLCLVAIDLALIFAILMTGGWL
jgi:hypothetical protein